jgi:hypothetical protein
MNFRYCFLLFTLYIAGCSSTTNIPPTLVNQLTGNWDEQYEDSCKVNFHSLEVRDSGLIVKYISEGYVTEDDARQVFRYDILSVEEGFLRVQLENESRLDSGGKAVIWHLKPQGNNQYCWGRDDWPENGCTPVRIRCR